MSQTRKAISLSFSPGPHEQQEFLLSGFVSAPLYGNTHIGEETPLRARRPIQKRLKVCTCDAATLERGAGGAHRSCSRFPPARGITRKTFIGPSEGLVYIHDGQNPCR